MFVLLRYVAMPEEFLPFAYVIHVMPRAPRVMASVVKIHIESESSGEAPDGERLFHPLYVCACPLR